MPYSAIKVANEFLRLAGQDNPPRFLTPLQLIKLVYIAHGWSLHFSPATPLLNEPTQAWQYGPVVPSLYSAVRGYGSSPIASPLKGDTDPQEIDEQSKNLIAAVFNAYAHYSGVQLSSMTHQPDTPWFRAWNEAGRNAVIGNDAIKEHYDRLALERAA